MPVHMESQLNFIFLGLFVILFTFYTFFSSNFSIVQKLNYLLNFKIFRFSKCYFNHLNIHIRMSIAQKKLHVNLMEKKYISDYCTNFSDQIKLK